MSLSAGPSNSGASILNIHTPSNSFSIVHSFTQDSLETLYEKLSRKPNTDYEGEQIGPAWLKYEFNDTVWDLDDDSDYTIFVWRLQQQLSEPSAALNSTPTLYLRNPSHPLPQPPAYRNPSYYLFRPSPVFDRPSSTSPGPRPKSTTSRRTRGSKALTARAASENGNTNSGVPSFRKDFERFHSENGVRTVIGTFGHVKDVRMLLKSGYRHVYISRKFALKNGFIDKGLMPGYGYSGLVNIGKCPISLNPSSPPGSLAGGHTLDLPQPKTVEMMVYLSEEPHFDIVLGRAFFEKRQIKIDPVDLTDVICLDTGEKVLCEVVILKDGKGEFVTVT